MKKSPCKNASSGINHASFTGMDFYSQMVLYPSSQPGKYTSYIPHPKFHWKFAIVPIIVGCNISRMKNSGEYRSNMAYPISSVLELASIGPVFAWFQVLAGYSENNVEIGRKHCAPYSEPLHWMWIKTHRIMWYWFNSSELIFCPCSRPPD